MTSFSKSEDCPSSHELLQYENGDMPLDEGRHVREHLAKCEFCSAEVEFYAHYPQTEDEVVETADIPAPLYDLAESLLSTKRNKISSLDRLLDDLDD